MTERIISHRTWTATEPDPNDRQRYPMQVKWTETVVLRDMTDEEQKAIMEALNGNKPGQ